MRYAPPILVALVLTALPAPADVLHLTSGGKLEGDVTPCKEGYRIRTVAGTMVIAADQVVRVEKKESPLQTYEKAAARVGKDDATGHFTLAMLCKSLKLRTRMRKELQTVVALDPDHAEARALLGHVRHKGKWLTREELMRSQGKVQYEGKWLPADHVEKLKAWKARVRELRKLELQLNAASAGMASRNKKAAALAARRFVALAGEAGIKDPEGSAKRIQAHYDAVRAARARLAAKRRDEAGLSAATTMGTGMDRVDTATGTAGGKTDRGIVELPRTKSAGITIGGGQRITYEDMPITPMRIRIRYPARPKMGADGTDAKKQSERRRSSM
jgi:hypothetical protein